MEVQSGWDPVLSGGLSQTWEGTLVVSPTEGWGDMGGGQAREGACD